MLLWSQVMTHEWGEARGRKSLEKEQRLHVQEDLRAWLPPRPRLLECQLASVILLLSQPQGLGPSVPQ